MIYKHNPHLKPPFIQIITAHYQTHSQYYVSGWITGPYDLEPPSRHEVAYISFLFSIVCMLLYKETIKVSCSFLDFLC